MEMICVIAFIIGAVFAFIAVKDLTFLEYYLYGWSFAFIGAGILKHFIGVI